MAVVRAIAQTLETNSSRRVYGEPVTVGDITIVPAARVVGRGGGGGGVNEAGADRPAGEGSGGGLAQSAAPVGAFVVRGGRVTWRPAVDVNKIVLGGQIVAIVALLTIRSLIRRWNA